MAERSASRNRWWLVADVAIGAAASLGQAPLGFWPISLIAFALLIWRVGDAATPRIATRTAFLAGFGYFAAAMFWITEPFLVEAQIYGWMAPFALVFLAAGGGIFWAITGWTAAKLAPEPRARGTAFAAALVLCDWIRSWLFTGLPWALTGHIWIDTPAGQFASIAGSIGLSALTMLVAALPLWLRQRPCFRGLLPGGILALLTVALAWSFGLSRLATPLPPDQNVTLRLVQPNAQQALKWDPYWSGVFFQRLIDLSAGPTLTGQKPDAVIWPETAVNFFLNDAPEISANLVSDIGAPVLLGIQREENGRYYNSFAPLLPGGKIGQIYDKFHLVPFGEYTPWGDYLSRFGISAFAAQHGNGYSMGPGPRTLRDLAANLPPVQVLICYEAIFSRHVLAHGPERPDWILQITNDAWFGNLSGPWQHLAQARLRAIESGLPVIRVANTGVSAVIDAHGQIRASLGLNVDGRIDTLLPAPLPETIWSHLRDWPAILAAFALLLGISVTSRRRLRLTQNPR